MYVIYIYIHTFICTCVYIYIQYKRIQYIYISYSMHGFLGYMVGLVMGLLILKVSNVNHVPVMFRSHPLLPAWATRRKPGHGQLQDTDWLHDEFSGRVDAHVDLERHALTSSSCLPHRGGACDHEAVPFWCCCLVGVWAKKCQYLHHKALKYPHGLEKAQWKFSFGHVYGIFTQI